MDFLAPRLVVELEACGLDPGSMAFVPYRSVAADLKALAG